MARLIRSSLAILPLLLAGCGDPAPPATIPPGGPVVDCQGVPAGTCQQALADAQSNAVVGTGVVSLRVACTAPPCTMQNGQAKVDILYSNGRVDSFSAAWAGAMPAGAPPPRPPALTVAPACHGVPADRCREFATSAMEGMPAGKVVASIVVRCQPGPCTPTNGDGTATVTFTDGTTMESGWGYGGG